MALFKIFKGQSGNLGQSSNGTNKTYDGYAYFTPDDGKFYIDIATSNSAITTGTNRNRVPLSAEKADLIKQYNTTNSENYKILLSYSANPQSGAIDKINYGTNLTYNPVTNKLSTGNIKLTGELDVTGNAYLRNETSADSLTAGSLLVNGAANFVQYPTAPTPVSGDNSTKVATTEFVTNSVAGLSGAMHFRGTTTTAIVDGSTTNPISINGSNYTAVAGDVVLREISSGNIFEYVWTGSAWEMLGRDTSFKVQQTAVSSPTASGSTTAFIDTISQDTNGNITVTKKNLDTNGTWNGNAVTATTASKLNNTAKIGNTNKPVYFTASGVPAAISYTIDKSVPSNAVFTDRYVNSASFEHDTTNNNIKMTLTRAGSDTATVTANIPAASSASSGVVTTEAQTFAGNKTFNGNVDLSGETEADSLTAGNLQVNGSATFVNTINGNVASATKLASTGTTGQFWRGDNQWASTLTGNLTLNSASGNSPALVFTRDSSLTDWKIFVTSGKLSFQSATDASAWTERAYFKDNSGDFVVDSITPNNLTASQAVSTDANKKLVSTNLTVSDPTASGTGITYIATISQSAVGKITATKSTVRSASTSQTGVVQLNDGIASTSTTLAATANSAYTASRAVRQSASTTANWRKILLHYQNDAASTTAVTDSTNQVYAAVDVSVQPSTGTIRATKYNIADHISLEYDSTTQVLNFVFS